MQNPANDLFTLLHERLSSVPKSDVQDAPPPFPSADKYLLASLIQKAIRRGDLATARRAGHQLLALDPGRLWRRLRATTLEDIGIGDVDAAAELVGVAMLPDLRRLLGGNTRALDHALARGCNAAKDRTPDHLHSVVEREPGRREQVEALRHASDNALVAILADDGRDWTQRTHAAAVLHGHCEGDPAATRRARLALAFAMFQSLGAPELLVAVCQAYAARERDILPLYVLLAWSLLQRSGVSAGVADHALAASALIDGIPEFGFDPHHTRVGRRAVQLWRRSYLAPPPWTARQIGMALWNIEAAACDKTLDWPLGRDIRRRAYRADLLDRGVPEGQQDTLYTWVLTEQSALTCARHAALRSARAT